MLYLPTLTHALAAFIGAASLLANASPVSVTPGEAIEYAKANGIDLAGPIPDDYTSYNEEEGRYDFEAGSQASAWARAQVAAVELNIPSFAKRANSTSGVGIGMWQGPWCSGAGFYINEVLYNVAYVSTTPLYSVGVSRRTLVPREQLDFSKLNGNGDYCGTYAYTASRVCLLPNSILFGIDVSVIVFMYYANLTFGYRLHHRDVGTLRPSTATDCGSTIRLDDLL